MGDVVYVKIEGGGSKGHHLTPADVHVIPASFRITLYSPFNIHGMSVGLSLDFEMHE